MFGKIFKCMVLIQVVNAFATQKSRHFNIESRYFYYPRQNSLPGPYHLQVGREELLIFLVKGEDNGNLFQNVLL